MADSFEISELIPKLQEMQDRYRYLPEDKLYLLAEDLGITTAQVFGVATFYEQFRFKPAGKHTIRVCIGTACHVKNAKDIIVAYREFLEIRDGEDTDSDKMFTIEEVSCLGCCVLAPAVQIDDIIYGNLTPEGVNNTIADFLKNRTGNRDIREIVKKDIKAEVRICLCSSCCATGAIGISEELQRVISLNNLDVNVKSVSCSGLSYKVPLIEIIDNNGESFLYGNVSVNLVEDILFNHFKFKGLKYVTHFSKKLLSKISTNRVTEPVVRYRLDKSRGSEAEFCKCQKNIVTERAGELNPLDIDEYVKNRGFEALNRLQDGLGANGIIAILKDSGLRGRGGAGYPTFKKWQHVLNSPKGRRFIICNGDEGDPGAFMDRMILESFPFRVIEGMAIAANILEVEDVYLYIRDEYPLAISRVKAAITECKSVLDNKIRFHVCAGAGAFICGEETALIEAIEGRRGEPREKGPYPSEVGLYGYPTLVNNVETFASIPWIIRHGAVNFSSHGTKSSPGTKLFALAGKITRGGLIEVPMGISLRTIVEDIGGGIENGGILKAVQIGGPSGGCVPERLCDTLIDYEELNKTGSIMGSGGLVVLDHTDCMVELARYFMEFTQKESCGRCTYCRVGTKKMLEILTDLCENRGRPGDILELEKLAKITTERSKCGLGKNASGPVLSTILHFRDEYEQHINGFCTAGKCKDLITYTITNSCIGCTKCSVLCGAQAIGFTPYKKHIIDQDKCTRCGSCFKNCPEDAIDVN